MEQYIETFDAKKKYDRIKFFPRALQSRELNDLQIQADHKLESVASCLYDDGQFVRGKCTVSNGQFRSELAKVYVRGFARDVEDVSLDIKDKQGMIAVEITYENVTFKQDPSLGDPFEGENFQEEGASRRQYNLKFLFLQQGKELKEGQYRVFTVVNGSLKDTQKAPTLKRLDDCRPYDHVVSTHDLNFDSVPDGSRVLVKGGETTLSKTLVIGKKNLSITFDPSVRIWGTNSFPASNKAFIEVHGGFVTIADLKIGFQRKADLRERKDVVSVLVKSGITHLKDMITFNFGRTHTSEKEEKAEIIHKNPVNIAVD